MVTKSTRGKIDGRVYMMIKARGPMRFFEVPLRISAGHHHPAFIFAAASSARRYTGPCAVENSQAPASMI